MAGTGLFTAVNSTLWVALTDVNSGEAMLARCSGAAPTTAGKFAEGCLMIRIDNGKLYSNQGSAASPSWDSVSDVDNDEITDATITNAKFAAPKIGVVQETVLATALVDGTGATGTHVFTAKIPAGSIVTQSTISALVGFAGDTSATITIGDGSTANRYNTSTPNVFATAAFISAGAVSGTGYNLTEITVTVTVTSNSDITSVISDGNGSMVVTLFYYTV